MQEYIRDIIRHISQGDTSLAESFFRKPGGRKYLENLTLILIHTLAPHCGEKEEMYLGFLEVLDRMEQRLQRQQEGQEILENAFRDSA